MRIVLGALAALVLLAGVAPAQPKPVIVVQSGEAATLDWHMHCDKNAHEPDRQIFDTLLRRDLKTLKLEGNLAESWRLLNETTWQFKLRRGIKFHNGEPLDAAAVKYSIERMLNPKQGAPGRTSIATIDHVDVVDASTVNVVTSKPFPLLPVRMSPGHCGTVGIVPPKYLEQIGDAGFAVKPVGTGPYKFVEWVKDERLVMEANRDWWGWEGKAPTFERVVWKPIPDDFPRIVALEKGEVDIITNVPPDRMKSIAEGRGTRIVTAQATRYVVLSMNTTQPPLSDKRVRQAMHYALDVPAIIKNLYAGMGKPFSGGVADTDFGYNAALKPYPYDAGKAKALLTQAGYGGGVDLIVHAGTGTMVNDKALIETIVDMWSRVGIRGRIEMMEMGARQRMNNERAVPPSGLLLGNPQSTLLDADGSLWRIFHPTGFNGKYWIGSQPGQRFHDLMEQARYSLDPKKRKALYAEATAIIHEEKPWLELFQEVVVYGTSRRVAFKPRADYRLIVSEMQISR
jgi:peptide/nickel transport system substrate-binding protein